MPIINIMSDDTPPKVNPKTGRPTTKKARKDRVRAKKKSHKLTERHVQMIRSQKGKMSCREIAKWFGRQTHYVYKVSHVTVSLILSGKIHSQDTGPDIYDMILAAQSEETTEQELDVVGMDTEDDLVDE
jgi:hypothetical protein